MGHPGNFNRLPENHVGLDILDIYSDMVQDLNNIQVLHMCIVEPFHQFQLLGRAIDVGKRAGFSSHFGRQNSGPSTPWSGCMLQCYRRKLWLLFPNRFAILVRNKPILGLGLTFSLQTASFFAWGQHILRDWNHRPRMHHTVFIPRSD